MNIRYFITPSAGCRSGLEDFDFLFGFLCRSWRELEFCLTIVIEDQIRIEWAFRGFDPKLVE